MKNKLSKSVSFLLIASMLPTLGGCKGASNNTKTVTGKAETTLEGSQLTVGDDDDVHLFEHVDVNNIIPEVPEVPSLEPIAPLSFEDVLKTLIEKNTFLFVTDDVMENPFSYPEEVGAMAGYLNIIYHGLTLDDIKDELHNIMVLGQVPRCCTEDEFNAAVGILKQTLRFDLNPFSSYYPLAKTYHLFECLNEHEENEFGMCTCDDLKSEYNEKYCSISLREYLDLYIEDPVYEELKLYVDSHKDVTMDMIVNELNNVVNFALLPGAGMDEESWMILFGHLQDAMGNEEYSLFEKYTPLAMKIYNLFNPDDELELTTGNTMLVRKKKGL